jgi:hypothetical protein
MPLLITKGSGSATGFGFEGPGSPYYSSITWTTLARPSGSITTNAPAIGPNYVVIGSTVNNTVYRMDSGGNITSVSLPVPTTADFPLWTSYGNGIYVAVGYLGKCVWTSTDAINWTVTNYSNIMNQSSYTVGLGGFTFYNGNFAALLSGGTSGSYTMAMTLSTNGTTWGTPVSGTMTKSDNVPWQNVATDTRQTTFFSPSRNTNAYYWSTSITNFNQYPTSVPWVSNGTYTAWVPELSGFIVVANAGTKMGIVTLSQLGTAGSVLSTLPTACGAGLATLSNFGKGTIILACPWVPGGTMQVSYNLAQTWQTTTLPSTPSTGVLPIPWNNKFYLVGQSNPDYFVCIGTPT